MKTTALFKALALTLAVSAAPAHASLIRVAGNQVSGTGLGAVSTVVTVQDNGNGAQQNGTESGCVVYNGTPATPAQSPCALGLEGGDNTAGNAGNNMYVLSNIAGLTAAGNLGFVVNVSEGQPGNTATLTDLYLSLFNTTSMSTMLFSYDGPDLALSNTGGVGQSGDTLFILDDAQAAMANTFCPTLSQCVVGGGIQFAAGTTEATPETVYVASITRRPPPTQVPEPMSLALLGIGLLGLGAARKHRA